MQIVNEKIDFCDQCEKRTIHKRNESKINWLMHIFLVLITGGLWFFVFFLMVIFSDKSKEDFVCSECGNNG